MSPSYGYSYLTSYGWTGTGTGLRKGAIEKPLAIPPKKNLSGLGKDRDEAFPFWDHLFAAASKAITVKVSSDDEDADDTDPTSRIDPTSVPLRRTTTGILSNQRPISGTPASTSGSTTPSLPVDADPNSLSASARAQGRLSLLATAKREAAKRGLYARFFRGPVLGPDHPTDEPDLRADDAPMSTPSPSPSPSLSSARTSSASTPVLEHVGETLAEQSKKRKSEDRVETKEERRERKRLKRERKAARAARKAEKTLAGVKVKEKKDRRDRKAQKHRDLQTHGTSASSKKASEKARKSAAESAGDDLEPAGYTGRLEEKLASTNVGQQDTRSRRPPSNVNATDVSNIVLTTKKKNGKRKDTPS